MWNDHNTLKTSGEQREKVFWWSSCVPQSCGGEMCGSKLQWYLRCKASLMRGHPCWKDTFVVFFLPKIYLPLQPTWNVRTHLPSPKGVLSRQVLLYDQSKAVLWIAVWFQHCQYCAKLYWFCISRPTCFFWVHKIRALEISHLKI